MRIVTWNIRGALGMDGVRSIDRILQTLLDLEADLICLQEVHRGLPGGAREDQAQVLARSLRYEFEFSSAMRFRQVFGCAILSRLPITRLEVLDLQNRDERRRPGLWLERRILQRAAVQVGGREFTLLNTHWGLSPVDRVRAAKIVANVIGTLSGPLALCGDLNAPPDADEIRQLGAAGLRDAGVLQDAPTFPADTPLARIDYVWLREAQVTRVETLPAPGSDHLPVVVDVTVETGIRSAPSGTLRA